MKALLLAGVLALTSCGTAAEMQSMAAPVDDQPVTTEATTTTTEGLTAINGPATVNTTTPVVADRIPKTTLAISSTPAAPPFDPVAYVNALPYSHGDLTQAMAAFYWVASSRGWTQANIVRWTPFVKAVIARESGGCWNVRYGQHAGVGCRLSGRARGTAAGFGQVIARTVPYICREGLCSHWDIIASPWNSMTALVALIEHSGKSPWCFNAKLRRGSVCRSAPG